MSKTAKVTTSILSLSTVVFLVLFINTYSQLSKKINKDSLNSLVTLDELNKALPPPIKLYSNNQIYDGVIKSAKLNDNKYIEELEIKLDSGELVKARIITSPILTESDVYQLMVEYSELYDIKDGSIVTSKLANKAVTESKLGDGSVTNIKLVDGVITNSKLTEGVVLTYNLGDGSVTEIKIASDAVTGNKIMDSTILLQDLSSNSVDSSKIVDGSIATIDLMDGIITNEKLSNDSVDSDKIINGSVNNEDLADDSVTTSKILDMTISLNDLADSSVDTLKIVNGTILEEDLMDGVVTLVKLANDSVDTTKILNGTIVDEDISNVANIAWSKISKVGSSVGDMDDADTYYEGTYLRLDTSNDPITGTLDINSNNPINIVGDSHVNALMSTSDTSGIVSWNYYNSANNYLSTGVTGPSSPSYGSIGSDTAFIYSMAGSLVIGNDVDNTPIIFTSGHGMNESMRINGDGNVGIGNNNPSYDLDITGDARITGALRLGGALYDSSSISGNNGDILVSTGGAISWRSVLNAISGVAFVQNGNSYGGVATLGTNDGNALVFETGNTERMRIDTNGNVGIGNNNPLRKLVVSDTSGVDTFMSIVSSNTKSSNILFGDTDMDYVGRIKYDHLTNDMTFNLGNTQRVTFLSGGGHGLFGFGDVISPSVNMVIRDGLVNNASRLYIMPNGNPGAGLQSGIKMFGTDFISDGVNYNDFGLYAGSDYNYINSKANGTGIAKDFVFTHNDTNYLMTIKTGGNVGIGTTSPIYKLQIDSGSTDYSSTVGIRRASDTATANGYFALDRARNTLVLPSSVQSGDVLGTLVWRGYGTTDYQVSASIAALATETFSDTAQGTKLHFEVTPNGTGANQIAMVIDQNKYVGIGATTPDAKLHINTGADATKGLIVRANSVTQSANLTEWQDSTGTTVLSGVKSNGNIFTLGSIGVGEEPWSSTKLHVLASADSSVNETKYLRVISSTGKTNISTGVINSGYLIGVWSQALRNLTPTDDGTLQSLYGVYTLYGHRDTIGTNATTNVVYGMNLNFFAERGTLNNVYDIYIGNTISSPAPTINNRYGFYMNDIIALGNSYAIYTNKGLNRLGDQLSIIGSADRQQLIIGANTIQTTNLTEWLNSSGVVVSSVSANGDMMAQTYNLPNNVSWTQGSGAPVGACSEGSLYSKTSAPGQLYVCENSTWVAK